MSKQPEAFTGLMRCADCGKLWSGSRWHHGADGPPMEWRQDSGGRTLVDTYPVASSAWCSGCSLRLVDEEGRVWTNAANLLDPGTAPRAQQLLHRRPAPGLDGLVSGPTRMDTGGMMFTEEQIELLATPVEESRVKKASAHR